MTLTCFGFIVEGAPAARAQHVVTDSEAGKLTLDALTATPRPLYRPIMAMRRVHRSSYVSHLTHVSRAQVRHRRIGVRLARR